MTKCKKCGKQILFVRTPQGKNLPVEPEEIYAVKTLRGGRMMVTPGGRLFHGKRVYKDEPGAVPAYLPHWAACKNTDVGVQESYRMRSARESAERAARLAVANRKRQDKTTEPVQEFMYEQLTLIV